MKPKKTLKRIAFAACEGKSELRYTKMLNSFAEDNDLDIFFNPIDLDGGGYAKMANKAIDDSIDFDKPKDDDRKISIKTIFFDTDNLNDLDNETIQKTDSQLKKMGFIIIRQCPNHEAFLWRHFNDRNRVPPDPGKIKEDFKRFWPDYEKNYPADDLKKKVTLSKIIEVAHSLKGEGESGFIDLLLKIGFKC